MSSKKFVLQFDFEGNIAPIKSSVEDLQKSLKNVKIPDNIGANLQKTFSKLGAEFDNFEAIVKSGFDDLGNISKAEKSFGKIINLVNQLSVQAGSINGIDPKKLIPQESLDRIKGLEKAWAAVKEESSKKTNLDKEIEKQTKEINEQQEALKKLNDEYAKLAAKNKVLGSQKGTKTTSKNAAEKRRNEVVTQMSALEGQKGGKSSAEYKALSSEYSSLSQQIKSLESEIRNLDKEIDGNKVEMAGLTTQINSSNEAYEKMKTQLNNLKNVQITPSGLIELRTEIAKLTSMNIDEVPQDLEELQKVISGLTDRELDEISKSLVEIKNNSENLPGSLNGAKEGMRGLGESGQEIARAADDVENLKNQVLQFFSITNSVQLFKRAITSALNTVKELDATMTEAAVVTEFDVGDMWEKLPQYSKEAQNLGVSINGMYQATTLYYQQGLKNQAAMELGIETMKMAKIAGMESTEATEAMTAALRGFNMELNETSATRVNDAYSQLAAVTAADTNQIATAMEKTASIAASANMEFETTAALLAQIIETTQEAPETAGTAMKTIIARFAEVKSLREQGLTSGEDDEGEIIDVNKIQAALRSVGISMEGFFSGEEGLDSVLLKLAEKWGSLDFETQRYIATMAAGSRQQSRFIAMMSDYGRTTELVGEAQNSAGASQKQFEKTQESLATSLTRLKNAWDQFLMGLANDEILKAGVNGLTKILETVNKITDGISGGNGLVKSVVSLAGVLATLKGGKALLGGTAVGGAMSGLMGKLTGGKGGEGTNKTSFFSVPEGFGPDETTGVGKAKRAELRASAKQRLKGTFKIKKTENVVEYDKKAMQKRIGQSYNSVTPEQQKGLVELGKQLKNNEISAEAAAEKMKTLGIETKDLNTITQKASLDFNAMGQAANTVGMAMMAAGAAASLLASAFESWGMEEEAETLQKLSGVLMAIGPILMGIGSFLPVLTGLTAAQAAATWAALWPILLVVAALGALVAAFVLVSKAKYENSLEGRMEAAAEATEKAKESAESAKQAYDNLFSDKSKYEQLQEKLSNLTAGTDEWKKTLLESNSEVMNLIASYKKLSNYIEIGEDGQLIIKPEGFEELEKDAAHKVVQANTQVQIDTYQEKEYDLVKSEEDYYGAMSAKFDEKNIVPQAILQKTGDIGYLSESQQQEFEYFYDGYDTLTEDVIAEIQKKIPELTKENIQELWEHKTKNEDLTYQIYKGVPLGEGEISKRIFEAYQKDSSLFSNMESLQKLEAELGISVKEIQSLGEEVVKYGEAVESTRQQMSSAISVMLSGKLSPETLKKDSADEAMAFTSKYFEVAGTKGKFGTGGLTADQIYDKNKDPDVDNENLYLKQLGQDYGYEFGNEKNDLANLQGLYKAMSGKTDAEIEGLDAEKLAELIADLANADYAAKQTEELINKMEALDPNKQKIYGAALSGDLTGLNKTELDTLTALKPEDIAKYFGLTGEQKDKFISDFSGNVANAIAIEQRKYEDVAKRADEIGVSGNNKTHFEKGSATAFSKYVDLIEQSILTGGKDSIEQGFEKIFEHATDAQDQKIMTWMETVDWTKEGAGEEFLAMLEEMDIDVEKIIPNGKEFCNQLKQVNALYRDFDTASILNNVTEGLKEAEEIAKQSELTHDQYAKYLEEGLINADEWSFNGKGWVNVTNGMSGLVEALKENTLATYNLTVQEAQKQVDYYNGILGKIDTFLFNDGVGRNALYHDSAQAIKEGSASKADLANLGITQDEYDKFIGIDINKTQAFLDTAEKFDISSIDLSDDEEKEDVEEYYNTYEQLTTIAKQRERLEKYRNKLLEDGNAKLAKEQRDEQRQKLIEERNKQYNLANSKYAEIQTFLSENNGIASMGGLSISEDGTISVDTSAVNAMATSDREKFDEVLSTVEGLRDQMRDAQDSAIDVEIEIDELDKEDRTAYIDITNRIRDALISQRQDEIDELSAINDSINDTNSAILDSLQDQIDEYRQTRDNAETEEEIAEKQKRLAYLQQDSSGANALAILELQEEIEEAQEDYTDTLIDQKISELQEQNDEAAEQRQEQIDIMEAQLAYDEENGAFYEEAKRLLESAYNADGTVNEDSEAVKLLKDQEGFDSKSDEEKEEWTEGVVSELASAYNYKPLSERDSGESVMPYIINTNSNTGSNSGTNSGTNNGNTPTAQPTPSTSAGSGKIASVSRIAASQMGEKDVKNLQAGLNDLIDDGILNATKLVEDGIYGSKTTEVVKVLQQKLGGLTLDGKWGPNTYDKFHKSSLNTYETGGLADFTGPAWLDGTKSKPEYVLSADQTKAFFTLVDVLSGLKSTSTQSTQNNGEYHYDIDINVEKMDSDTDLEEIARKIEDLIVESSRYRNNNNL